MLTIRREQMYALGRDFDDRLIEDMISWLLARLPHLDKGSHSTRTLQANVANALARSRSCGLMAAEDHRSYLLVSAVLGWDFHTRPPYLWFEHCLANPALGAPSGRMADALQVLRGQIQSQEVSE
jgi:hypothetical protein